MDEDPLWLRKLLDAGRLLTSQLDRHDVPARVLAVARELTGARYAALGVLSDDRMRLRRFEFVGIDERTRAAIGALPEGRGVLGVLIDDPRPLRLRDVSRHPESVGFPPNHPVMRSFLGVPISIEGQAWGNLYLAEKDGGEFTAYDEEAAVILAGWAAIAIENSRLYETSESRRSASERMSRALQATRDVTLAIASDLDLERVLQLIAERAHALVGASQTTVWLPDGEEIELVAACGEEGARQLGARAPLLGTVVGTVLRTGVAQLLRERDGNRKAAGTRALATEFGGDALVIPMLSRGSPLGVLTAIFDDIDAPGFPADSERLLWTFAASASSAVELARSLAGERLRVTLAAAESERTRWARELHDETLQDMAALRMRLGGVLRSGEGLGENTHAMLRGAMSDIERQITSLRAIVGELRPPSLQELGLRAAIESMLARLRASGTPIEFDLAILTPPKRGQRLDRQLETTAYRLTQEAVTNCIKHANASKIVVNAHESSTHLEISVSDDGKGFDPEHGDTRLGLRLMHERVTLAGGTLRITSHPGGGTHLTARLPSAIETVRAQATS